MRKQAAAERHIAADRAAAFVDARNLVLELAGMQPGASLDPTVAGIVPRPGETLRRLVNAWLRQRTPEGWTEPSWSQVFVTDQRLLVRLGSGELASLWWGSLVGFEADLAVDHVDTEYCLRARQRGLHVVVNGSFEFPHAIGDRKKYKLFGMEVQAGGHSPQRRYMIGRNTAWLARGWVLREPAFAALCMARLAYEAVGIVLAETRVCAKLWALLRGAVNGLFTRMGRA